MLCELARAGVVSGNGEIEGGQGVGASLAMNSSAEASETLLCQSAAVPTNGSPSGASVKDVKARKNMTGRRYLCCRARFQ